MKNGIKSNKSADKKARDRTNTAYVNLYKKLH